MSLKIKLLSFKQIENYSMWTYGINKNKRHGKSAPAPDCYIEDLVLVVEPVKACGRICSTFTIVVRSVTNSLIPPSNKSSAVDVLWIFDIC